MPIIFKPATVNKGEAAEMTLSKSALAALPIVSGDAYFSVQSNWNKVILHYVSSVGGQIEPVIFDASLASPTANFLASLTARDEFEIDKIIIEDFDNGRLLIDRSLLTVGDFDISLSSGGGGGALYTKDFSAPGYNSNVSYNGGIILDGTEALFPSNGSPVNELNFTDPSLLGLLTQGNSYTLKIYFNQWTDGNGASPGAASLNIYFFGGYDSFYIAPTQGAVVVERTITASNLSSYFRFEAQSLDSGNSFSISKVELLAI